MSPRRRKRDLSSNDCRRRDDGKLHVSDVKNKKAKSDSLSGDVGACIYSGSSIPFDVDFSNPRTVFESLVAPTTFDEFFSTYWEKKPLLVRRRSDAQLEAQQGVVPRLFSKEIFERLLAHEKLEFVRDVNMVRYVNGQRHNLNGRGRVTVKKFRKLFKESKGTMQIHQPQRFQDELWRILESLESFFGCLVGSNVYMTPTESQGLPPHHDDVEVFILQLEGEKHWKLYKPQVELPREYSIALLESDIGSPIMDFILKPGDLLYFPRGTIHQAQTTGVHSTHVTISTYQRQSWGDYLLSVFPSLLEETMAADVMFRRGLPINFLCSSTIAKIELDKLHSVVDLLLSKLRYSRFLPPESMIDDFMHSRLPPFAAHAKGLTGALPEGSPPNLASKVQLKYIDHICFLVKKDFSNYDSDDDDDDDDDGDDAAADDGSRRAVAADRDMLYVYSSLFNDRRIHMMGAGASDDEDDQTGTAPSQATICLKFRPQLLPALTFLKSNSDHFILVGEIPCSTPVDVEHLVLALWSSHLLDVQPATTAVKSVKVK